MPLEIRPDHLKIVEEILEKHLPDREVWAFGSRVNGTAKETSDLDLVVIGETPLDFQRLGSLRDDFSESNLPYKVDVVDWAKIGETFREIIRKDNVLIKKVNKKEWTEATFSELCDITRGASPRPINDWTSKNGVPWVKISDASASMSRFIEKTNEYIKKEAQSKSVTVFPGDLILSNSATPGIPKFMKIEACVHDGWLLLRNFRGISKVFAYYLLLHERSALIQQGNGSVFTNLKTEILKKHKILLPSLAEQRAIAHILGTLDDKIELNRRMNETLEAMAQALFKSWFVDFDPVRAKMEGRPTGLPKEIEDLFPDSFEDSELGEIPRGWRVLRIGEVLELSYGKALKEENRVLGEIPVMGSNGQIGWHNEYLVRGPGIVVGRKGNPGIVTWVSNNFFPIDTTFYVSNITHSIYYIYYSLIQQNLVSLDADSAVPGLNRNQAYNNLLLVPPQSILNVFDGKLKVVFEKMDSNSKGNMTLSKLRDPIRD